MDFSNLRHLQSHKKQVEEVKSDKPDQVNTSSHSLDIDDDSIHSAEPTPKVEEKKETQPQKVHKKRKQNKVPPKVPE